MSFGFRDHLQRPRGPQPPRRRVRACARAVHRARSAFCGFCLRPNGDGSCQDPPPHPPPDHRQAGAGGPAGRPGGPRTGPWSSLTTGCGIRISLLSWSFSTFCPATDWKVIFTMVSVPRSVRPSVRLQLITDLLYLRSLGSSTAEPLVFVSVCRKWFFFFESEQVLKEQSAHLCNKMTRFEFLIPVSYRSDRLKITVPCCLTCSRPFKRDFSPLVSTDDVTQASC